MPWSQFLTIVAQVVIGADIVGVIAAAAIAIVQAERGKK